MSFPLHFLLHPFESFIGRPARSASSSEPESLYAHTVSRTGGRSQLCGKLQSSGLVCARKSLPSNLLLVSAKSSVLFPKKHHKNPVPTNYKVLSVVSVCVVSNFPVRHNSEDQNEGSNTPLNFSFLFARSCQ
jgi:hypothetical protein